MYASMIYLRLGEAPRWRNSIAGRQAVQVRSLATHTFQKNGFLSIHGVSPREQKHMKAVENKTDACNKQIKLRANQVLLASSHKAQGR